MVRRPCELMLVDYYIRQNKTDYNKQVNKVKYQLPLTYLVVY